MYSTNQYCSTSPVVVAVVVRQVVAAPEPPVKAPMPVRNANSHAVNQALYCILGPVILSVSRLASPPIVVFHLVGPARTLEPGVCVEACIATRAQAGDLDWAYLSLPYPGHGHSVAVLQVPTWERSLARFLTIPGLGDQRRDFNDGIAVRSHLIYPWYQSCF